MSKQWNPGGGFPSPEQVERMVAAEVRHLAEAEYARQRGIEEEVIAKPLFREAEGASRPAC